MQKCTSQKSNEKLRSLILSRVLVISEKPTAAKRIAEALDDNGTPKEIKKGKASYFECNNGQDILIIVYALGHLFELKQTVKGWKYPRLDVEWVPKYEVVKKATQTKPIINLIKNLAKDIDYFIIATDYDIEGSLIGYLTLKYACKTDPKNAQRMVFSNLTKNELQNSYENIRPHLDFPLVDAGWFRHEIDWIYGINFTRALTLAIKNTIGWFKIISTGRVQGPTLAFVAERDQEINLHVPIPFWRILTEGKYKDQMLELEYSKKRIEIENEAISIVKSLQNAEGHVRSINKSVTTHSPPAPFNLSGLQSEAYRHFGYKPSRTLAIAQKLYLEALISYPRTNSQRIPESIDTREILTNLGKIRTYKKLTDELLGKKKLVPVQGKKTDPAHPAIHPTGNKPEKITPSERKLYDLIVRRFLSLFADKSKKESIRADIISNDHLFYLRGLRILEQGWIKFYEPYSKSDVREIPPLAENDIIDIVHIVCDERFSPPPPFYNPSSLLKVLENANLGTKATRAGIVDSLKSRGYTLNDRFELSTLGYTTFETLQQYMPLMLSSEFTRQLEEGMEAIQTKNQDRESALAHARKDLLELLNRFQEQEKEIGNALVAGLQRFWKEKQELGICPKCNEGKLIVIRSPKTGKRFVGCSNYKEKKCDQTFPLPQKGEIRPLDKKCEYCGYQMFSVVSPRRKWETCVNWTKCPGRVDEIQALEEQRTKRKQKEEESS